MTALAPTPKRLRPTALNTTPLGLPRRAYHNPTGLAPVENGFCTTCHSTSLPFHLPTRFRNRVVQRPDSTGASPMGLC